MSFDPARHLDAVAPALDLVVTEVQRPGVLRFLETANAMWRIVDGYAIPDDDATLAPRFVPGDVPLSLDPQGEGT
ncbi:DUF4089 domain-containing protein [Zavarzinia sp. CC-PAN008]|uniref:DUF4089 domain-containing protein n=1 Tax=Zavarzinia sp. CC-PAN008 TaxID=3243332 RepID=UPI003F748F7D